MGFKLICVHDTVSSPRTTRTTMTSIATNGVTQALAGGKTRRVPGPLYNELFWPRHLYPKGDRFTPITGNKSNNAGTISHLRYRTAARGDPLPTSRPPRGKVSHNATIYGLAIVRPGDGILDDADIDLLAKRCLALLLELNLPANPNLVVGHSELTSRKVDPAPWQTFMSLLRARMVTLLTIPEPEPEPRSPLYAWYADDLAAAVEAGITDGSRPEDAATRYEAAIMAARAAQATLGLADRVADLEAAYARGHNGRTPSEDTADA